MRDELYDRDYQVARGALNDGLDRLFGTIASAFLALHRAQWSAPWKSERSRDRTGLA
jgi:hypothetical protein